MARRPRTRTPDHPETPTARRSRTRQRPLGGPPARPAPPAPGDECQRRCRCRPTPRRTSWRRTSRSTSSSLLTCRHPLPTRCLPSFSSKQVRVAAVQVRTASGHLAREPHAAHLTRVARGVHIEDMPKADDRGPPHARLTPVSSQKMSKSSSPWARWRAGSTECRNSNTDSSVGRVFCSYAMPEAYGVAIRGLKASDAGGGTPTAAERVPTLSQLLGTQLADLAGPLFRG